MLIWSVICITLALVVLLFTFPFSRKTPLIMARTLWSPVILFLASAKTKVTGLENIDRTKTYIIIANHASFLDIPVLFRVMPLNIRFIAKKELKKVPFLGWFMSATDMIFINRSNNKEANQSLKEAAQLIRNGKTVLIFPEGTVSENGEIGRFKKGGFHIALEAGVELLPVSLKNTAKIWPIDSNTNFTKGTVAINVGKPISLENYNYNDLNTLTKTVQEEVISLQSLN